MVAFRGFAAIDQESGAVGHVVGYPGWLVRTVPRRLLRDRQYLERLGLRPHRKEDLDGF